jgi:hypothetical protein
MKLPPFARDDGSERTQKKPPGFAPDGFLREKASGERLWVPPARAILSASGYFMELATLLRTVLTLLPTVPIAVIAATAISEAISVYSMAVAPCSDFIRRRKMDSMENPSMKWMAYVRKPAVERR